MRSLDRKNRLSEGPSLVRIRAMNFKTPPKSIRYDQNLVADQPGRWIFFSGFFVALILGLVFRGVTAPQRVQAFVTEAASKIHKDINVTFESAEVSLSHNGFPRLAVVIHQVEMNSSLVCWGQPQLQAKEIILPFSFLSMVFEKRPFKKVLATEVDLKIRSAPSPCVAEVEVKSPSPSPTTAVTLAHRRKDMEIPANPAVDRLEIDQLRLQYLPSQQSSVEVVDFSLQIKSHSPKVIFLEAKTHLIKESFIQNFASSGNVAIEYKEFPEEQLSAQFYGHWREGSYSLKADYKMADSSLTTEAELKHIPATQVISALKNYGWLQEDWDGRKMWVTMKGHSQGKAKEWEKLPVSLNDVLLEGDLGEISVDEFRASQLKPLVFKPLQAQIKNLKVAPFLEFLKQPRRLSFLGELGEFNGHLELTNDQEMHLMGKQTGLEFIFSNKGSRQVQKVTSLEAEVKLRQNKWDLTTSKIIFDQGQFEGNLKILADRDLKKMDVQITAETLTLAPAVQKLMTGFDQKASFRSQVQIKLQEGRVEQLTGFLKTPDLLVEQLHFEKFNSQFSMNHEILNLQISAQNFQIQAPSKAFDLLAQVTGGPEDIFKLKQLNGRFEMSPSREVKWKNVTAQMESKNYKLASDGQWNSEGVLAGKIQVGGKTKPNQWNLLGHRDHPQVEALP